MTLYIPRDLDKMNTIEDVTDVNELTEGAFYRLSQISDNMSNNRYTDRVHEYVELISKSFHTKAKYEQINIDAYVAICDLPVVLSTKSLSEEKLVKRLDQINKRVINNADSISEGSIGKWVPFGTLLAVTKSLTFAGISVFATTYGNMVMKVITILMTKPVSATMLMVNSQYVDLREQLALEISHNQLLARVLSDYSQNKDINITLNVFKNFFLSVVGDGLSTKQILSSYEKLLKATETVQAPATEQTWSASLSTMVTDLLKTPFIANILEAGAGYNTEKLFNEIVADVKNTNLDSKYAFNIFYIVVIVMLIMFYFFATAKIFDYCKTKSTYQELRQSAKQAKEIREAYIALPESPSRDSITFEAPRRRKRRHPH